MRSNERKPRWWEQLRHPWAFKVVVMDARMYRRFTNYLRRIATRDKQRALRRARRRGHVD